MSTAPSSNKYLLKSIEEDIELFDRKLAHLHKFEIFQNEDDRMVAAGKLSSKRERLLRTLRELTDPAPVLDASAPAVKKTARKAAKPKVSTRSKAAAAPKDSPAIEADLATQPDATSDSALTAPTLV
jgi:hypothetical protein